MKRAGIIAAQQPQSSETAALELMAHGDRSGRGDRAAGCAQGEGEPGLARKPRGGEPFRPTQALISRCTVHRKHQHPAPMTQPALQAAPRAGGKRPRRSTCKYRRPGSTKHATLH